ncbi:PREDICTED: Z-DNA-binding protein 1 isoform X3 [Chinchilla lanigera]|uniref:Z-DNA-binding protein 1 isoform X3 n=1 Tax=Chinchilla lanigera TaxID=34839 RepID=UPI0006965723|nr:PREDICTED: Z-DNA-binding protein 1 isoform X3 [Chinchilla lanigera]
MAEAPAEPSAGGQLEQKILQALRKASSTVRTPQLVKECQVPKQELNRVLYQMQKESKVSLVAPATWCLGGGDPHGLVPAEPAQPSIAQRPQQAPAAASESPGPRLSNLQERIYRFLEASGPCRALHIAKALGMRTAKDVNPDLYKMGSSHLLSCDEKSKEWKVSGAEDSGRRHLKVQPATIIYQQNPINMVYQSQISIANSEATQIGHGNVIVRGGENVSPTVAAGSADASFEVRMPKPGPDPEGDMVQRIRIKSCHLEDAAIGNSNKMTVTPGTASRGRAAGPREDGGREPEPGQQQGDAGAPPEAAGSRGSFPPELGQAPPVLTPPTSELSTLTLEKPEAKAQTL